MLTSFGYVALPLVALDQQASITFAAVGVFFFLAGAEAGDVAVCPGENRDNPDEPDHFRLYKEHKCNVDATHRVCAQLLDDNKAPKQWGGRTFWEITSQSPWVDRITSEPNSGTSWCICMWATAEWMEEVGCQNAHIDCAATDIPFVMQKYTDQGTHGAVDLANSKKCLCDLCSKTSAEVQKLCAGEGLSSAVQTTSNVIRHTYRALDARELNATEHEEAGSRSKSTIVKLASEARIISSKLQEDFFVAAKHANDDAKMTKALKQTPRMASKKRTISEAREIASKLGEDFLAAKHMNGDAKTTKVQK